MVLFALAVWLWRRPALTSARRFDVQFRLNERVSTALELGAGAIHTQRRTGAAADRRRAARGERDARRATHLPLAVHRRDWLTGARAGGGAGAAADPAQSAGRCAQPGVGAAGSHRQRRRADLRDDDAGHRRRYVARQRAAPNAARTVANRDQHARTAERHAGRSLRRRLGRAVRPENHADDLNQQASANQAALQQAANALQSGGGSEQGDSESAGHSRWSR